MTHKLWEIFYQKKIQTDFLKDMKLWTIPNKQKDKIPQHKKTKQKKTSRSWENAIKLKAKCRQVIKTKLLFKRRLERDFQYIILYTLKLYVEKIQENLYSDNYE